MAKLTVRSDEELARQRAQMRLWGALQRGSRSLIYSILMRAGGEPFGAPFEVGLPSLTERIVQRFRQRGFFGFESLERLGTRARRNKYTRHAAAPFRGAYPHLPDAAARRGVVGRLLDYLRANRALLFASVQPPRPPPAAPPRPPPRRR